MEILAGYVKGVAFFMIFMAFVELIAPSGGFKAHIRLVLSLALIAVALEPFAFAAGGGVREISVFNSEDTEALRRETRLYDEQAAQAVVYEYKKGLNEQARQLITDRAGVPPDNIVSAEVCVDENYGSESFGEITAVYVTAALFEENGAEGAARALMLGNADDFRVTEAAVTQKIKNCLSDFYNVHAANIHITVTALAEK